MSSEVLNFSIVIPTYNRPERLSKCLQSLMALDYPRDRFEVVVVDDGSKASLESVVRPFAETLTLQFIRQPNAGPASARNTGANAAQGAWLVFTDDDCQPAPSWLTALEAAIAAEPEALIGGKTLNALPENLCSTASQLLIDYLYEYFNPSSGGASFFASNNFAVPRQRFQTLGGFDTSFPLAAGEDREFCDRWRHANLPLRYAPEMQIYHAHQLTLKTFWRQHFNYGRGAYCFHKARATRTDSGIQVERWAFYWNLLTYPLGRLSPLRGLMASALMFVSQVANVSGFAFEKMQQGRQVPRVARGT